MIQAASTWPWYCLYQSVVKKTKYFWWTRRKS